MDFLKKKPVTDSLIAISIENTLSNFSGIGYHFIALLFSLVWIRIFNVFDHLRDTNKIRDHKVESDRRTDTRPCP